MAFERAGEGAWLETIALFQQIRDGDHLAGMRLLGCDQPHRSCCPVSISHIRGQIGLREQAGRRTFSLRVKLTILPVRHGVCRLGTLEYLSRVVFPKGGDDGPPSLIFASFAWSRGHLGAGSGVARRIIGWYEIGRYFATQRRIQGIAGEWPPVVAAREVVVRSVAFRSLESPDVAITDTEALLHHDRRGHSVSRAWVVVRVSDRVADFVVDEVLAVGNDVAFE